MSGSFSVTTGSDVTLPVPPLSLSSLDNVFDDETPFATSRDDVAERVTGRESDARDGAKTDRTFERKKKKLKSTSDVETAREQEASTRRRRKSTVIKRADSLDSLAHSTSRSILKRSSVEDLTTTINNINNINNRRGSVTERPLRRVSLARRVSFRGGYSEPPTPVDPTGKKKFVSFGSSPRDAGLVGLDQLDTGLRMSSVSGQSPEKPKGPLRRRQSMMNVLRTELMKTNKLKLPERAGVGQKEGNGLEIRKEKSSDEILSSAHKDSQSFLKKRMSMPTLTRKDSSRSIGEDEDDVFMSSFHRRKLTLLTSLEKMGVKLPKRRPKFTNEEAEILQRAGQLERHGSLTSRTVLSNFDVRPKKKPPVSHSPEKPLDDVTRSKLQQIFDTMTKEDAKDISDEQRAYLQNTLNRRVEDKQVTALPGLTGKTRYSVSDNDLAGSTASVFMSRLRRRKDFAHAPRTSRDVTELPGVKVSHALINHSKDLFGRQVDDVGLYSGDIYNKVAAALSNDSDESLSGVDNSDNEDDTDDGDDGGTGNVWQEDQAGSKSTTRTDTSLQKHLKALVTKQTILPRLRLTQTEISPHPAAKRARALSYPAPKPTREKETFTFSKSSKTGLSSLFPKNEAFGPRASTHLAYTGRTDETRSTANLADTRKTDKTREATNLADTKRTDETRATANLADTRKTDKTREATNLADTKRTDVSRGATNLAETRRSYERQVTNSFAETSQASFGSMKPSLSLLAIQKRRIARAKRFLALSADEDLETSNITVKDILEGKRVPVVTRRRARWLGKRGSNRFKNLSKFVCLLLRAWRIHSVAVQAILDYHHTVDVSLDNEEKGGLLFDITEYKADTEARLSTEAIRILKKRPKERTPDEIHFVQVALWNYKSLAEYPVHMQRMIAERAWFESYGAKRVIVREGHLPMCFYFVLSGSALVSVMDLDKGVAKTVMYYNRGDSFGELAIINRTRRQSTVISKDNMQLLVLSDTDFVEVFMSGGLSNPDDPFLNSLPCLDGWPKEKLSENPKKANYSYFKRGTVLAADSNKNEWIIIVKSGSVSLLKKLKNVDAKKAMAQRAHQSFSDKLQRLVDKEEATGVVSHEDRVDDAFQQRQDQIDEMGHLARFYALPQIFVDTNEGYNELKRQHDEFTELHGVSALHARELATTAMSEHLQTQDQQMSRGASNISLDRQGTGTSSMDTRRLSGLVKKGPFMSKAKGSSTGDNTETLESRKNTTLSAIFGQNTPLAEEENKKPVKAPTPPMYVNVHTLTKGMVFGLSDLFFDNQPSMALVSNGAECVSISKKLFMEHASHAFVTRIREDIYPYPSEEDLQENLESQMVWDFHRRQVVTHVVQDIQWTRADKSDARLNISPALGY